MLDINSRGCELLSVSLGVFLLLPLFCRIQQPILKVNAPAQLLACWLLVFDLWNCYEFFFLYLPQTWALPLWEAVIFTQREPAAACLDSSSDWTVTGHLDNSGLIVDEISSGNHRGDEGILNMPLTIQSHPWLGLLKWYLNKNAFVQVAYILLVCTY